MFVLYLLFLAGYAPSNCQARYEKFAGCDMFPSCEGDGYYKFEDGCYGYGCAWPFCWQRCEKYSATWSCPDPARCVNGNEGWCEFYCTTGSGTGCASCVTPGYFTAYGTSRTNYECASCNPGHYLSGTSCIAYGCNIGSGSNCVACVDQGLRTRDNQCGDCNSGYYLYDGTCIPDPTMAPTTGEPTEIPSMNPTTQDPTQIPSKNPTTEDPTRIPSNNPTTGDPTQIPSNNPTTEDPTQIPSNNPTTEDPTMIPSNNPTTDEPTWLPTTEDPTQIPSKDPTTEEPSLFPTTEPTKIPSTAPITEEPTHAPSKNPTTEKPNQCSLFSCGEQFNCAIEKRKTIICWGIDQVGQVSNTPLDNDFQSVASGDQHSCGLHLSGKVTCWGFDDYRQQISSTPVDSDFVAISCGSYHSCGLHSSGKITCWGDNNRNQISDTPEDSDFIAVDCVGSKSAGLRSNGEIVCWGFCDDEEEDSNAPTEFDFVAIAMKFSETCALRQNGAIRCWGNVRYDAPAGNGFVAIDCYYIHCCALHSSGSVECWGTDYFNEVSATPTDNDFIAISIGYYHSCAMHSNGEIECWGSSTGSTNIPTEPDFARFCPTPTDFTTCITEWMCVPRDDSIIVARLNHGEVECMGRPGKEGQGKCYWNAPCDENSRPTTPSDYFITMDELCAIHDNCANKCKGGWCKVVKDTFMNDPYYDTCMYPTASPTVMPSELPTLPLPDITSCITDWRCIQKGTRYIVARLNHGEVECMGNPARTKEGPSDITQCYWTSRCDWTGRLRDEGTDYWWTMDELCEIRGNCEKKCKGGWCKIAKDTFMNDPDYSFCADSEITMPRGICPLSTWEVPARGREDVSWTCCSECPGGGSFCYDDCTCRCSVSKQCEDFLGENEGCFAEAGCSWIEETGKCVTGTGDLTAFPTTTSPTDCPSASPSMPPTYTPGAILPDLTNCITEWRCVPRDDDIIVARINHGEVECMGKPGKEGQGNCYWNAQCDENGRPIDYSPSAYYYTMDELCEIRGNCPNRCQGGWCKVVKDTFMNDPDYAICHLTNCGDNWFSKVDGPHVNAASVCKARGFSRIDKFGSNRGELCSQSNNRGVNCCWDCGDYCGVTVDFHCTNTPPGPEDVPDHVQDCGDGWFSKTSPPNVNAADICTAMGYDSIDQFGYNRGQLCSKSTTGSGNCCWECGDDCGKGVDAGAVDFHCTNSLSAP